MDAAVRCGSVALFVMVTWGSTRGQSAHTSRASVDSAGVQGNDFSGDSVISADGRFLAFDGVATNLVPGDTNGTWDVFVRDRQSGLTSRVSIDSAGIQGNDASLFGSLSADGRYVAFMSYATNLVPGDTNGYRDIFVRDRQSGLTSRVSVDSAGGEGNADSYDRPSISADGRYVAFQSIANNLVPGDTNGTYDIFVHDRQSGQTSRVSVDSLGTQGNGYCYHPSISADGRFVAFDSDASNLVTGDSNGYSDIFVHDLQSGQTSRDSLSSLGAGANGNSAYPSISADGRYVAFWSAAFRLVPGDTNEHLDVFVRDRQLGQTSRVSVDSAGAQADADSSDASISADGRFVGFSSHATNLVTGDTLGFYDVFVHDRQSGDTTRVSVNSAGVQGNDSSFHPTLSADGRLVGFDGFASNLVPGDTNGSYDVFVRDLDATGFTSLCDPGQGGVASCPCSNPPAGTERGCDNSSGTGGASLSASGVAYLSPDSLVFTTTGENPTATSILLQGSASPPSGAVYGQGVRCVGGTLKRLFVKTASAGSITAPDFGAGDPTVSARSAAKGDPIQPGQSRWYLVYYRDPIVLGGCPASSTFNATQTGGIGWGP